jgi:uncharacterized membrane protein
VTNDERSSRVERAAEAGEELLRHDRVWPAQVTVLGALLIDTRLPDRLTLRPGWLLPSLEGLLLVGLVLMPPTAPRERRRGLALTLVAAVSATNLLSLVLLSHELLRGSVVGADIGHTLVLAGVEIWLTNVLIFSIWYWELDRGGPRDRRGAPDFLFPQMTDERLGGLGWLPGFFDYLYTSFTNATAFSPTDTMPLTQRAKLLMMVQSGAALWTVGLVVARAVNILS